VVPSDGSGDLSFTRASNGTRINSAGLVEVTPWNLVQYSEDFSNAYWSKDVGASVDSNVATAPNGTTTADRLNFAGAGQAVYTIQSFGGENTFSVYLKGEGANIGKQIYLEVGVTSTVTLTGEWQRFEVVANSAASVAIKRNTSGQASAVLAWGIQMNIGALKPYFPTTDRLNVPRLTYQNGGGGCPSLLLEKQSTNALTYSEDFTQSDWPKQNTIVTANATTSPDGTQNADKLIANTTNARHLIYQAITTPNTHTFTTYAKAGENSFLIMRLDTDTPEVKNWFNLSNGTVGTSQGGSPTITSVGNGWYRCSMQYTPSTLSNIYAVLYTAKTDGVEGFAGNDSDGTYIWGAQLEASSYPTSYIPTTSASATRVADACFKTGISSLIGQSQGTFFVDANIINPESPNGNVHILMVGTTTERITIYTSNSGTTINTDGLGGGGYVPISGALTLGRNKIAVAYANNDVAFYVNGNLIGTRTTATIPSSMSQVDVGGNYTYANYIGLNTYNEVVFFKTRLTNAELASLTTI
jgi:hypothetical protein